MSNKHKWFCDKCGKVVELKEHCECGKSEKTGSPIIMVSENVFMWKSQRKNKMLVWIKHQLWRMGLYPDRCFYCGSKLIEHGSGLHQYFTCSADDCRFNSP